MREKGGNKSRRQRKVLGWNRKGGARSEALSLRSRDSFDSAPRSSQARGVGGAWAPPKGPAPAAVGAGLGAGLCGAGRRGGVAEGGPLVGPWRSRNLWGLLAASREHPLEGQPGTR